MRRGIGLMSLQGTLIVCVRFRPVILIVCSKGLYKRMGQRCNGMRLNGTYGR